MAEVREDLIRSKNTEALKARLKDLKKALVALEAERKFINSLESPFLVQHLSRPIQLSTQNLQAYVTRVGNLP